MSLLRKGLNKLYLISGWVAAAFIAAICLLVVCQVTLNGIDRISGLVTGTAVGLTIPSYADFTGFFLAAASFLALAHSLKEGTHIRVTLVYAHLSSQVQQFIEAWCLVFASFVTIYFTWYTAGLVHESYSYHDLSSGMIAIPLWIPQSAMLTGLTVLSIALVDNLICVLVKLSQSFRLKQTTAHHHTQEK